MLRKLIWRQLKDFTIVQFSLHNLLHMVDDIKCFSSPDNYWCYVFERAIHKYVIKSLIKNLELTFAQAEIRREVLKFNAGIESNHIGAAGLL